MPDNALADIHEFLPCRTPDAWIDAAIKEHDLLLIDHANCEKKAAGTALSLLYKYIDRPNLLHKMSKLAREELRHFEQVMDIMTDRGVDYVHVSASRYAAGMHALVRKQEPYKLIDTLIVGAFIEARSCERFAALAPHLDPELATFYTSLLNSEGRHFKDYLTLARQIADEPLDERISEFARKEQALIQQEDGEFRFHSGPPTVLN